MPTEVNTREVRTTQRFESWLSKLKDRAGAARIKVRLRCLELGNPGKFRNLLGGVRESKVDFGPGYRVYFTERGTELIILLCGGDKSSQPDDIAAASAMVQKLEDGS